MKRFWIALIFGMGSLSAGMAQADVTMAIPNVTGDPAAVDIRFRVAYPGGCEPVPSGEKGVVLELRRSDVDVSEMLVLRMEKMTQDEAAWIFAETRDLKQEARVSLAQRVIGRPRTIKVLSLEHIRLEDQPALLVIVEEEVKNATGTFFQKEMIQVVWAWGRKITQNYRVTGPLEKRMAVVKRFARGERGDPGAFMGSLQILNRAQMDKAVPQVPGTGER